MSATPQQRPLCLTIAGSDSSGGAGLQQDLAVFRASGCCGASVTTCVTAQSHQRFLSLNPLPASVVRDQLEVVLEDLPVAAIKTGALATREVVASVAELLRNRSRLPLVIDPVLVSTSGKRLLEQDAVEALKEQLIPQATLITPNLPEAQLLSGNRDCNDPKELAHQLWEMWHVPVLVKGGHLPDSTDLIDRLHDGEARAFPARRVPIGNVRGTGCALSAAIASHLAQGHPLRDAIKIAKTDLQHWLSNTTQQANQPLLNPTTT
jgi:hydroxymethylpyrimidine/phosphomethylpyrimidine kinase